MTIRRISPSELRKTSSLGKVAEPPPLGISPVLRASWRFAQDMAHRFNRELLQDRAKEFLKKLVNRFV